MVSCNAKSILSFLLPSKEKDLDLLENKNSHEESQILRKLLLSNFSRSSSNITLSFIMQSLIHLVAIM